VPELEGVRATIAVEDLSSSGGGVSDARERVQPGPARAALRRAARQVRMRFVP